LYGRAWIIALFAVVVVIAGFWLSRFSEEETARRATAPTEQTQQVATPDQTQVSAGATGGALTAFAGNTLKVATEGANPPFNSVDASGALVGFDVDIANALCAKMLLTCEIVKQNWDGMIAGLQENKYDAIIASMAITEERRRKIGFSDRYYDTPTVVVAKADAKITLGPDGNPDPASLKGLKIGVRRATVYERFARSQFPTAEIAVYDTGDIANLDLTAGRIDVRIDDILALEEQVIKPDVEKYRVFGKGYVGGEFGEGMGVGLRKADEDLRQAFNAAIKAIRADGTYKAINDKYFTIDVYGPDSGS
jgi:lysine-arginine-ornithine-binding protein